MNDTRELFDRVLTDEPPLRLGLDPVVAAGRRVRRRRQLGYAAAAAGLAVLAAGVALPLTRDGSTRLAPTGPSASASASATPARQAVDPRLTPDQRAVAAAVIGASPAGWTFDFAPDRWERYDVHATADDGRGKGALWVTLVAKWQHLHPCREAEGSDSVPCTERELADGSVLAVRTFPDSGYGTRSVQVVLAHPDGSAVRVQSANHWLTWPPPKIRSEAQRERMFHVTRTDPVYTAAQLTEVALALAEAVRTTPIVLSPAPGEEGPPPGTKYPVGS